MDIRILRTETESDHRAVENSMPLMHAGVTAAQYVGCLSRVYGVIAAWERRAAGVAPEWMQFNLIARRRLPMLQRDLAWFGAPAQDKSTPDLPWIDDLPSLLGAMYVMEGSTLGGQLIARHIGSELNLTLGQGDAYFRGHGDRTGAMWKEFGQILKESVRDKDAPKVIASAKSMFTVFGDWMREKSAVNAS